MTKSYAIPFEELLPMSMEEFLDEYKGKKHFIARSEEPRFVNHFSLRILIVVGSFVPLLVFNTRYFILG